MALHGKIIKAYMVVAGLAMAQTHPPAYFYSTSDL